MLGALVCIMELLQPGDWLQIVVPGANCPVFVLPLMRLGTSGAVKTLVYEAVVAVAYAATDACDNNHNMQQA